MLRLKKPLNLDYIFLELADKALIAKRDGAVHILDFTMTEEDSTHAVIYTQVKEMFGNKPVQEIYDFVDKGLPYKISEMEEKSNLDAVDVKRIKKHALMSCSWSRQSNYDRDARIKTRDAFCALLKTLSMSTKDSAIEVPSNESRKGTYAFRWTEGEENGAVTSICIKPRTDTEKEISTKIFGTRRSNYDSDMKSVGGQQMLINYSKVKAAQVKIDRNEVMNDMALKSIRAKMPPYYVNHMY